MCKGIDHSIVTCLLWRTFIPHPAFLHCGFDCAINQFYSPGVATKWLSSNCAPHNPQSVSGLIQTSTHYGLRSGQLRSNRRPIAKFTLASRDNGLKGDEAEAFTRTRQNENFIFFVLQPGIHIPSRDVGHQLCPHPVDYQYPHSCGVEQLVNWTDRFLSAG